MIKRLIQLSSMLIIAEVATAQAHVEQFVGTDNPAISISGRWEPTESQDALFAYPGVSFTIETNAKSLSVELTDVPRLADDGSHQNNTFGIVIDDIYMRKCILKDGRNRYTISDSLDGKRHKIAFVKLTEGLVGHVLFHRFILNVNADIFNVEPAKRKIEFIGNSITCGYGIEATDENLHFSYLTENAYSAYAMQTSRNLKAEVNLVAYSGKGVYRNWADTVFYQETMLELYNRSLPLHQDLNWDFGRFRPSVVVINLGSNDFSPPLGAVGDLFIPRYLSLLKSVRQNYGTDVPIVCLNGPLLTGNDRSNLEKWINVCLTSLNDNKIYYLPLSVCQPADGWGADYHPSQKLADRNATELTAYLKTVLGW